MGTPHIDAPADAFADVVLLPGDPLRARWIADTFFTDAEQVTSVRNMLGFTGTVDGQRVSVMGTGMGIPSVSIYATELVREYGVKRLIRVGSCGAIPEAVPLRTVVLAQAAATDSTCNVNRFMGFDLPAVADFGLLQAARTAADKRAVAVRVGTVFTTDLFYAPDDYFDDARRYGLLAAEMETAGLYGVALAEGAHALSILTVTDNLVTEEKLSVEERQESLTTMVHLALDVATGAS